MQVLWEIHLGLDIYVNTCDSSILLTLPLWLLAHCTYVCVLIHFEHELTIPVFRCSKSPSPCSAPQAAAVVGPRTIAAVIVPVEEVHLGDVKVEVDRTSSVRPKSGSSTRSSARLVLRPRIGKPLISLFLS